MSQFSDWFKFMDFNARDSWKKLGKDPERIFIGAIDPASSWAWGKITGKKYEPVINQLGSPMGGGDLGLNKNGGEYAKARQQGINVYPAQRFHAIGDTIAGFYGGSALAGAAGGGSSAGSSAGTAGASTAPVEGGVGSMFSSTSPAIEGYSTAAPSVGAQFGTGAASGAAGTATGSATSSANLVNAGTGLLGNKNQQQQGAPVAAPVQDQQAAQRRQIQLMQEMQLQSLRQKPNKTLEEWQQLQMLNKNQGLLA